MVPSLAGAEPLDPALAHDAERLCGVRGAAVEGGVGPFGLWVLASADRQERTAVFFRVFRAAAGGKPHPTRHAEERAGVLQHQGQPWGPSSA